MCLFPWLEAGEAFKDAIKADETRSSLPANTSSPRNRFSFRSI